MTKSRSAIFLKLVKASHQHQNFSSSDSDSVLQERRTHYGLSKVSTVSDDELKSIVEEAVMHVPSPFNMQAGRAIILTGAASDKLWLNIVLPGYLKLVGGDGEPRDRCQQPSHLIIIDLSERAINQNTTKIKEYAAGYGTVMFFEDQAVLDSLSAKIPL